MSTPRLSLSGSLLTAGGYFVAVCLLGAIATRHTSLTRATSSMRGWQLAVFLATLAAVSTQGITFLGGAMSDSPLPCGRTALVALVSYLFAKLATYGFLAERVRVVCDGQIVTRKRESRTLRVSAGLVLAVLTVAGLLIHGRTAEVGDDDACVVGIHRGVLVAFLVLDAGWTSAFTTIFCIKVWNERFPTAHGLAVKAAVAAFLAVACTFANLLVIIVHGHEREAYFLIACSADLTANAVAIYTITSVPPKHRGGAFALPDANDRLLPTGSQSQPPIPSLSLYYSRDSSFQAVFPILRPQSPEVVEYVCPSPAQSFNSRASISTQHKVTRKPLPAYLLASLWNTPRADSRGSPRMAGMESANWEMRER